MKINKINKKMKLIIKTKLKTYKIILVQIISQKVQKNQLVVVKGMCWFKFNQMKKKKTVRVHCLKKIKKMKITISLN